MKIALRPTLSVSQPKISAPTTAPMTYSEAEVPTLVGVIDSVRWSCRIGAIEPTMVTSSPSRIQVMPSATTTSMWKRLQGSRSSRPGMLVWIGGAAAVAGSLCPDSFRVVAVELRIVPSILLMRSCTTAGSASVVVSPSSAVSRVAILRRMRRMILPDRVLGRSGTSSTVSGAA